MSRHHASGLIQTACPWVLNVKALISLSRFLITNSNSHEKERQAERKRKKRGICLQGTCCEAGGVHWHTTQTQGETLNVHDGLPFPFSLSNHLIPCIFGSHPKKTKAIISIQFVPSLCKSTDRLSYFGHAPSGELWEAGGQINAYYRSHQLITEHRGTGALNKKPHAEGVPELVIDNWCSFILLYNYCLGQEYCFISNPQTPSFMRIILCTRKALKGCTSRFWSICSLGHTRVKYIFAYVANTLWHTFILVWFHDKSSTGKGLSLPSWIHPTGLSQVWAGPAGAPLTTSRWLTTPESFLCWGCESPSCWRRCNDTAPCRGRKGPGCT